MVSVLVEQLQIVGMIVPWIVVLVMDNLFGEKRPTQLLFHHRAMLANVSMTIGCRVLGSVD
jgi:hypothetical protein